MCAFVTPIAKRHKFKQQFVTDVFVGQVMDFGGVTFSAALAEPAGSFNDARSNRSPFG
jgi:hypothetical protein